jgi:hypothetical protein
VAIRHPVGASQIECPCCHLIAPGPADKNPDVYERRRLAETGNIRRLQSQLQNAKDRNPELAAHLAGPISADSVRLDVPRAGGRRLGGEHAALTALQRDVLADPAAQMDCEAAAEGECVRAWYW